MMLCLLKLVGLTALRQIVSAESCYEGVSLCLQTLHCQAFSSLTEAVESATYLNSDVTFPQKASCEWTLGAVTLQPLTALRILNATVAIQGEVLVSAGSSLELLDINLRTADEGEIRVEGILKLYSVRLHGSTHSLTITAGGTLDIHLATAIENSEVINIISQANVSVSYSTFTNNSRVLAGQVDAGTTVYFAKCRFEGNAGGPLLSLARTTLGPAISILIVECLFHFNSALVLDLSAQGAEVAIQSSAFSYNSAGGLRVTDSAASVLINATEWTYNDNPFVWVLGRFSGTVQLSNSALSHQSTTSAIFISNEGSPFDCAFSVSNVEMSHFRVDSLLGKAGAIYSVFCAFSISNALFKNCTNYASALPESIGLMFLAVGSIAMSNVSITDCGGSGMLIAIMYGTAAIDAMNITNGLFGSDGVLVVVGSSATISNIAFRGEFVYWRQAPINRLSLLYAVVSTLSVWNITASGLTKYLGGSILGGYASTIYCDSLRIINATGNVAVLQALSDVRFAHIDCDRASFVCFATSAGRCMADYSHLRATHSSFSSALFCFGSGGSISLSDFYLDNSQGGGLISTYLSDSTITDWVLRDCQFTLLLKDMLLSQVFLVRMEVENVEGSLLSAYSSAFQITDCRFTDLRSADVSITLSTSSLTLQHSVLTAISTRVLIRALNKSKLNLFQNTLSGLRTSEVSMIEVVESSIECSGTSIFDFNATLIDSLRSPVTLVDSSIERGGPGYIYRRESLNYFGGVLSCSDCPSINITRVRVVDISADLGGALYITSTEADSSLTIDSSEFSECRATSGGIAALRNVSFRIVNSIFLDSSAEAAGGALDISIQPEHFRTIELCTFKGNSAHEGGAVKWRSAQPLFTATQFYNNSAAYGPDIASYGVQVVDFATESTIAPGQLASICFALQDHYGAQVTTANHQLLILNETEKVSIEGISHKVAQEGLFNFTEIAFLAPPNSNQTILVLYNEETTDNSVTIEYHRTISFRSCEVGEIARNRSCEVCVQGYYSLRLDSPVCSLCPSKAHCPGGNSIILKPNAWLTSDPDNPVVDCLVDGRCDGAVGNHCTEGHAGLLCGSCAKDWFPLVFSTCQKCPHAGLVWTELLIAIAIRAITVTAFIRLFVKSSVHLHSLKVLIKHVQMISLLCYVQMKVPVEVAVFLHLVLSTSSMFTANFPFQCFDRSYYYNAGVASLETPATVAMVCLYFLYNSATHRTSILSKHNLARVLILWSYLQSAVALMAVLPGFVCMGVRDTQWLVVDMTQQCWDDDHFKFLWYIAAPSLAFNVVLPVLLYLKHSSQESEYGQPYWEVVLQCVSYACVYSVTAQASSPQSSQLFVGLLFLYLESALNSVVVQYRSPKSLWLLQLSGFVLIASYSLVLFFPEDFGARVAVSVLFVLVNAGFVATSIGEMRKGANQTQPAEGASRDEQSIANLVPPSNSVVSEKGVLIILPGS